jgi:predicted RNA-binding Zn ribbon-like protein
MAASDSVVPAPFELSGGALCLDFANTWSDRDRPEKDRLTGYPSLLAFARQAGILGAEDARELEAGAVSDPSAARAVWRAARSLRESLYRLFSSQAAGREAADSDLAALNLALGDALRHSRIERRHPPAAGRGSRAPLYAWGWAPAPGRSLAAPLRAIARNAAELLTSEELPRVRECAGDHCTWLFLDRSRSRSRRWCSMDSCGNRAKARRHYRRARAKRR